MSQSMKTQTFLICLIIAHFSNADSSAISFSSKTIKRGTRYCHALNDRSSQGYRWGDPVIWTPGIVRFEGPRKIVPVPGKAYLGLKYNIFCFYALKPGSIEIMFKEYQVTVPGRTHYLTINVN